MIKSKELQKLYNVKSRVTYRIWRNTSARLYDHIRYVFINEIEFQTRVQVLGLIMDKWYKTN